MLEIKNLVVAYGPLLALHGVNLMIRPGEMVALVGPNGAGKSTLLKTISGLLAPRAGAIRWQDEKITAASPRRHEPVERRAKCARGAGVGPTRLHTRRRQNRRRGRRQKIAGGRSHPRGLSRTVGAGKLSMILERLNRATESRGLCAASFP